MAALDTAFRAHLRNTTCPTLMQYASSHALLARHAVRQALVRYQYRIMGHIKLEQERRAQGAAA